MRNITCKTTPVSRSRKGAQSGRRASAVAGAAYRAGENLKHENYSDDGKDKWFRYANRSDVVRETFIMAPSDAPEFVHDRSSLWNWVEDRERSATARLGREVQLGFAYELSHEEQRSLVQQFVQKEFVDKGFVADVAIHNYGRTIPSMGLSETQAEKIRGLAEAGIRFLSREDAQGVESVHVMEITNRDGHVTGFKLYQPHAHVRVTPRIVEDGEFANNKYASRELNRHETAMRWRYEWPELQNGSLERIGSEVRVSATSETEDEFPDLRFLGRAQSQESQAIEERRDALDESHATDHAEAQEAEAADDAFRAIHNESVKDAYLELEDPKGSTSEEGQRTRLALWWQRQADRFGEWKETFREHADAWRDRFDQHAQRIRGAFGWELDPEEQEVASETPSPEVEAPQTGPPEAGIDRPPEPEQEEPDR
ncbi:hypothetical protein JANAI62_37380 [Jannaschia pagri]|uniref:MobA/MobL protein domain-containing protein n=1 Tax=Jannaschia pagri TaxID=2829797 RepID=A0ABQ4NRS6_9RHOB|nr:MULTISPECIES: MobA/MobL family protein [unclassified Jannaschia]GIT93311.1 hypothetical protein JANAI61_37690 [Jannaschia sp. AI_61]GIT97115.1 hypothetical protein JANAI62_37380 [Jannaschia sp. AI_62]